MRAATDLVVVTEAALTWLLSTDSADRLVAVIFALGTAYLVRQIKH